jgi:hypothetical protein
MKPRNLNKIKILIERAQTLDLEIKEIHKLAPEIADIKTPISLQLSYENTKKKEDVLDSDGSLKNSKGGGGIYDFFILGTRDSTQAKDNEKLKIELNDQTTLACLGVIIQFKQDEIKHIAKQIEKINI